MNAAIEITSALNSIPYFGPAAVLDYDPHQQTVSVKTQVMGLERRISARIAIPHPTDLMEGDEVLIAGNNANHLFVIGIISSRVVSNEPVLKTHCGAYASLRNVSTQDQAIRVYSRRNELLFEYDPVKESAKVKAKGNLELCTEDGDIFLSSANSVRIRGDSIEINSKKLNANIGYVRFVFDRMETVVNTLIEQAKNVYRNVTQLTQLRTGRMRTLVDETYQFKANKAFMKAEDDFKIKGEKIHLG